MVLVYRSSEGSADRKMDVADGAQVLKVSFTPDVDLAKDAPSVATVSLFQAGKHLTFKEQLLEEVQGEGSTKKDALLKAIKNLIAKAQEAKKEDLVASLKGLEGKVIAEGIGLTTTPLYIPPSQRG